MKKANKVKIKKNNKFDLDNEIVIGLTRLDMKNKDVDDKKIKKKKASKSNKTIRKKKKRNSSKLRVIKYVFMIVCVIAAIIGAMLSPLFNIKEITVLGNEKISSDRIISLSQIINDENIYRTNMSKAKESILEEPYINSVRIKRVLPNKVEIYVEERKTTYMIEYGSGYVYINNQGYILEISSSTLEVPILQGVQTENESFEPGNRLDVEDLEKLSTAIKIMDIARNNEIANLISRIDIENKLNYKISFESEQKMAYLGDNSDLNTKILSIKSILEREKNVSGEIFVNMDLRNNYPTFRQSV